MVIGSVLIGLILDVCSYFYGLDFFSFGIIIGLVVIWMLSLMFRTYIYYENILNYFMWFLYSSYLYLLYYAIKSTNILYSMGTVIILIIMSVIVFTTSEHTSDHD
ncbi:hypothetical protein [Haloplasma contractile]|uniref:hypothetical protein n=1 Tax=Haloplasma contractile TaxID=471825 RepID=UPI00058FDD66|nr:hypothetical protein [Haloplasma contractile]